MKRIARKLAPVAFGWFFLVASYPHQSPMGDPPTFGVHDAPTIQSSASFAKQAECENVVAVLRANQPSCFENPNNPYYNFGTCSYALFGCFATKP